MPNTHPAVATVWNGQFMGVPNNGTIPFAMSNTYNLVGNPYPSPISMSAFVSENAASITGTLYFRSVAAGDYTIAIDHMIGLFETTSQKIYIKDNFANITHDLKAAPYTFATAGGASDSRFELVFQDLLAVTGPLFNSNMVVVYKNNTDLVINTGKVIMKEVKVYDIRGRLLAEKKNVNAAELRIAMDMTNEVLVVQITSDNNETVTKKMVN